MPHMVIFRTTEGKQAYHPTEALEDAIRFVEHLRNAEQVTDVHVFRLQEVPLEFKVLYKVEVGGPGSEEPSAAGTAPPVATSSAPVGPDESFNAGGGGTGARMNDARSMVSEQRAEATVEAQQSGGRFGLFSRS